MDAFHRSLRLILVFALSLLAAPAFGGSSSAKFFFAAFPTLIPVGASSQTFTLFNSTPPPGVSTVNSFEIDAPAGIKINSISPGTLLDQNTFDSSGRHVYFVNNIPGINSNKSANFTLNVTVVSATCHSATWGIQANTGNAYPKGDNFTDQHPATENLVSGIGCDGAVACENVAIPFDFGDGTSGGVRGWNKDGSQCTKVNYAFHVNLASFVANLQWDTGVQPFAAFEWHVLWAPEDVDSSGWPVNRHPRLAWDTDVNGNPFNWVSGVACLSQTPPFPYGILVNPSSSNPLDPTFNTVVIDTTAAIQVSPGTKTPLPASPPFPIVINTERMQVTAIAAGPGSATTLTVERGTASTGSSTVAAHNASTQNAQTLVMSTPLPIDPNPLLADGATGNPYYQKQDRMCVWDFGWTSSGINPATGKQQIRYRTDVFDVGDGWAGIR